MFAGVFVFSAANAGNTKRPGVMFDFFTRPTWFKNVDPEAGCDVKVGLESHNLMSGVVRALGHVATSESGAAGSLLTSMIGSSKRCQTPA